MRWKAINELRVRGISSSGSAGPSFVHSSSARKKLVSPDSCSLLLRRVKASLQNLSKSLECHSGPSVFSSSKNFSRSSLGSGGRFPRTPIHSRSRSRKAAFTCSIFFALL